MRRVPEDNMSNTPVSPTKPKSQTYDGQCHCGKIKFTVKLSPPIEDGPVTNCNCSICHTNGYLMVYPLDSNIDWISGFDEMTTYSFGKERIHHTFCPTCGTSIGGKSSDPNFFADNRALNVRTLKKVNIDDLKLRKVNGRIIATPDPEEFKKEGFRMNDV